MILGWTHRLPGGGCIRWQRLRATDEGYPVPKETRWLELRGVPFGRRTWQHLEAMLRHEGTLRKIMCNGLQSGNLNCMCADVKVLAGSVTSATISSVEGWDRPAVLVAALHPPPPPPRLEATTLIR